MEEAIKLILPFFGTPANYSDVLQKLASFAFYETYFITFLLRANPRYDAFFKSIESWGPIGKAAVVIPHFEVLNVSGFVIAFTVAILAHTFQFHDRISDVFGIRRRFDRKNILIPIAQRLGCTITEEKEKKIARQRDSLMRAVFYKYASSKAENPLVDRHDIEHALNAWSWFWAFVEGIFYFGAGAIIASWIGSKKLTLVFAMISFVLFGLALLQRARLGGCARPQVESIVADPTASHDIKNQFDAL